MPTTFHHRLMTALDNAQKSGAHLLPLHGAIRRALREANMGGAAITSPEALKARVLCFAPHLAEEARRFAA